MHRKLFIKIIDEISNHPVNSIVIFFRGESLLHPDFFFMIQYLKKKTTAIVQLATNGMLLDNKTSQYLLTTGIDFISFSLDAFSQDTYEKIRKGGDFNKVKKHIHDFLKLKKSGNYKNIEVQVSATETEQNKTELSSFIKYWENRVDRVRIYQQHSQNGKFGKILSNHPSIKTTARTPCQKLFNDMVICYNGNVALCNHDWNRKSSNFIGNINHEKIEKIWNGKKYNQIRQKHLLKNWHMESVCSQCDHWYLNENILAGNLIKGNQ